MKTILITGSSRGIGRAIAELAHTQGWRVIVHGRTESTELNEVHKKLDGSIKTVFDVADKAAVQSGVHELLKKVGAIDALVNNAGIAQNFLKDIAEMDDDKAIEEYKVNVLGTLHCTQAVLPKMVEKGGCSIVSISSIKGHDNYATMNVLTFSATKAGIMAMTKALAKAYPTVRFNTVSPGYVQTDQSKNWDPKVVAERINGIVAGRLAQPSEIAPLVMFLVSDDASYITGTDFLVDGGYSIKGK